MKKSAERRTSRGRGRRSGVVSSSIFAIVSMMLALQLHAVQGMGFDMQFQTKCFFQDIEDGQASTLEWRSVRKSSSGREPDPQSVKVVVYSPIKNTVITQDEDDEGKIFINAEQGEVEGDHKACFSVADTTTAQDTKLYVEWKVGALAQDWEVLAKKEHIDHISVEMRKYEDLMKEMRQEMLTMKKVDTQAIQMRESAHKRVEYFSLFTMIICIIFTVGQYFFLKKFFKNKKML
jgi:hypothetical protein